MKWRNEMPTETYQIAHIKEQNQDIIIVPMDPSIDYKTQQQKDTIQQTIQICATNAGLAGIVCLVWENKNRFNFMAPPQWHSYFRGLTMLSVTSKLNKTLTCQQV
jgi:hypothetical protein